MTVEERLNEQIEKLENKVSRLKKKLEAKDGLLDVMSRSWELHKVFENTFDLPFPRLEMRFEKACDTWYSHKWTTYLVYRHYGDTFAESKQLTFIPISLTTGNGGGYELKNHIINGKIETPFRDGVNIPAFAKALNIPAYIVCLEAGIYNEMEYLGQSDAIDKMVKK